MQIKIRFLGLIAVALCATALPAAAQTVTEQSASVPDPSITLLSLPSSTTVSNGLVTNSTVLFGNNNSDAIGFSGNSGVYIGTLSYLATAPTTPTGTDTLSYLAANSGGVELSYSTAQSSFNLLWGSADATNTLTFLNANGTVVGAVSGSQIKAGSSASGSYFVSVNNFSTPFTYVIATDFASTFEFVPAAPQASPAPAPALGSTPLSALALVLGAGLLAWRQRRNLRG